MIYDTESMLETLIRNISEMNKVQSIGISGSKSPLPKAGEGDIDIFIYCENMPNLQERQLLLSQLGDNIKEYKVNIFEGGHWGTGDFLLINGIETWLMYFTIEETLADIKSIINGKYPDKVDNYYYPIGRCAMLKNINVLYDKNNFLNDTKSGLSNYPEDLSKTLIEYHLSELEDTEDLKRAVIRKDVLFYHFAMDLAIDHFLQALFAANKTYFPSRKRTLNYIEDFKIKPQDCGKKLLEVIRLGSFPEGINQSFALWSNVVNNLKSLINN